jgi:cytochrome c peroxidase
MKTNRYSWSLLVLLSLLVMACGDAEKQSEPLIQMRIPAHFPELDYDLSQNPITNEGFRLGKALFFEGDLSRDGSISCGSCHIPTSAFTHHGHDISHGIDDRLGRRNTPPIMNLAWHNSFAWDGGVRHLDLFAIAPIEAEEEMDEELANVLAKLRNNPKYPPMFEAAFGTREITTEHFLKALSQFMLVIVSAETRYDKYLLGDANALNAEEKAGLAVFEAKCATCHSGTLLSDFAFRNNGLLPKPRPDKGRGEITLNPEDNFKFKTPSLRNVVLTAPYMHDGRFYTLRQVLDHYRNGVQDIPNLDPLLVKPDGTLGIELTDEETAQIIAFLQTLTDENFVRNPLWQE